MGILKLGPLSPELTELIEKSKTVSWVDRAGKGER
jgi:hypothetical protein